MNYWMFNCKLKEWPLLTDIAFKNALKYKTQYEWTAFQNGKKIQKGDNVIIRITGNSKDSGVIALAVVNAMKAPSRAAAVSFPNPKMQTNAMNKPIVEP